MKLEKIYTTTEYISRGQVICAVFIIAVSVLGFCFMLGKEEGMVPFIRGYMIIASLGIIIILSRFFHPEKRLVAYGCPRCGHRYDDLYSLQKAKWQCERCKVKFYKEE